MVGTDKNLLNFNITITSAIKAKHISMAYRALKDLFPNKETKSAPTNTNTSIPIICPLGCS